MTPRRALTLLAGLLLTPALFAQDAPPVAAPVAPSWIQAELIVFRNLDLSSAADESWPARPALRYPAALHFLAEAPAEAAPADTTAAPLPFTRLGSGQGLLGDAAARIAGSQNYRLLAHLAWRQPLPAGNASDHILVTGGAPHGEHWELEGYVSLARANFVHVTTYLWLNDFATADPSVAAAGDAVTLPPVPARPLEPAPLTAELTADGTSLPAPGTGGADPGTAAETVRATRSVLLEASRRAAPGETHYIDHPLFGVVLRIEPYDPAAGLMPAAPAPATGEAAAPVSNEAAPPPPAAGAAAAPPPSP